VEEDSVVLGFPEYGRLRRVLMHAPGSELSLIGPSSYRRYLFEDAIDPTHFRRQHEELIETLRSEGVEVILLEKLLRTPPLLELVQRSPNLVYTRDTTTVTPAGYIGMRMRTSVRRHEPQIAKAAMHQLGIRRFMDINPPATMEGGDLIFLDEETLLVGIGNRTNRLGLRQLMERTWSQGLRALIAIHLPAWVIHLDGTMMIVDQDLAIVHRESLSKPAIVFEEGGSRKHVPPLNLLRKLGFRLIEVTAYERQRRATNVITLGPRKLVGYAGNARVRSMLTEEGVDFIEVEGSELVRGGGGPRCMTAPTKREWRQSPDQAMNLSEGVP
jgi:arginine deiminase